MAVRPIFTPSFSGPTLVNTHHIQFEWFPGMAKSQSQKSIASLHQAAKDKLKIDRVLEISSKSPVEIGVKLSAFNIIIKTRKYGQEFSLECAYQSSKVFEKGGPFKDILNAKSIDAKRDPRLKESGRLLKFSFFGQEWGLEPRTAFYDWLYVNALQSNPLLASEVLSYQAFSDIAFNPEKSLNCQAYAAALYVSLHNRGLLDGNGLKDKESYLQAVAGHHISNAHEDTTAQERLL